MRFTDRAPTPDVDDDESDGVMHIGGGRGRRVREVAAVAAAALAIAAVLVGFFVWFGATVGWAVVLVGLMLGYMAAMARWAGGGR